MPRSNILEIPPVTAADGTIVVNEQQQIKVGLSQDSTNLLTIGSDGGLYIEPISSGGGSEEEPTIIEDYININSSETIPSAIGLNSIAIGGNAISSADDSIQLSSGNNIEVNTLKFQTIKLANNRVVTPFKIGLETSITINASVGELSLVDTSLESAIVIPPLFPQSLDTFAVSDVRGNATINFITVDFINQSQLLHAASNNYIIDINTGYVEFIYINDTIGWISK